jgi:hypothetical protein
MFETVEAANKLEKIFAEIMNYSSQLDPRGFCIMSWAGASKGKRYFSGNRTAVISWTGWLFQSQRVRWIFMPGCLYRIIFTFFARPETDPCRRACGKY